MSIRKASVGVNRWIIQHEVPQRPFRAAARLAIARRSIIPDAVTAVIVNWNSWQYLEPTLYAIRRFSADGLRVIVVDNRSSDQSKARLRDRSDVRVVKLPRNLGHGTALDIGFLLARTEYLISLDVDAFPIAAGWVERLIEPLQQGYTVSGAHLRGGFVHPCCLAIRLEDFVLKGHTFTARFGRTLARSADDREAPGWDVGGRISLQESRRYLIDRTGAWGPGDIGSFWDGLIYHNFYSTRFGSKLAPGKAEDAEGITEAAAVQAWKRALSEHLEIDEVLL